MPDRINHRELLLQLSIDDDNSADSNDSHEHEDLVYIFSIDLKDINENCIFLSANVYELNRYIIFIMNRNDNNNLSHYFFCDSSLSWMYVYNSNIFIKCIRSHWTKFEIHDTSTPKKDSIYLYKECAYEDKLGLFIFYSTASHKFFFLRDYTNENTEEFSNKEIAKFRVY